MACPTSYAPPPPTDEEREALVAEHARLKAEAEAEAEQAELDAAHPVTSCFHCAHAHADRDHADTVECRHSPPPAGWGHGTYTWPRVPKHGWCGSFLHPGGESA